MTSHRISSPSEEHSGQPVVSIELMSYDTKKKQLTIIGGFDSPNLSVSVGDDTSVLTRDKINIPYVHPFRFTVDVTNSVTITFHTQQGSGSITPTLDFKGAMSKLSNTLSYWSFGGMQATHNRKTIAIQPKQPLKLVCRELLFLTLLGTAWLKPRAAILRSFYWITTPFLGKRNIWLFSDKISKAGDNAEYVYRYALSQKDSAHKYYVLSDSSPDAGRLQREGISFVRYKSLKQRLLFLHANILVFTHNNAPGVYRFGGANTRYFRDLFNYDIMYVQHGLATQDTSRLYNRSVDDIRRFFVASPFETRNLLRPEYGYVQEEIITAGAARYDGLISKTSAKKIIIAPTWRKELTKTGIDYDSLGDATDQFITSRYFEIYISLLNNSRLLSFAKDTGYTIAFLLHPMIANQADSFRANTSVEILAPSENMSYEHILADASLLVTDYSGLQFDIAYMKKPVLYFHHKDLPPSYNESTYRYDRDAFGAIATTENEVVEMIRHSIKNSCTLTPFYAQRVEKFFYHHDYKNSKRTYSEIVAWQQVSTP